VKSQPSTYQLPHTP